MYRSLTVQLAVLLLASAAVEGGESVPRREHSGGGVSSHPDHPPAEEGFDEPSLRPSQLLSDQGRPPRDDPVLYIHIIGERHSGTNHLQLLLKHCLLLNRTTVVGDRFIEGGS